MSGRPSPLTSPILKLKSSKNSVKKDKELLESKLKVLSSEFGDTLESLKKENDAGPRRVRSVEAPTAASQSQSPAITGARARGVGARSERRLEKERRKTRRCEKKRFFFLNNYSVKN